MAGLRTISGEHSTMRISRAGEMDAPEMRRRLRSTLRVRQPTPLWVSGLMCPPLVWDDALPTELGC